jgi:hypothetical protein
MINFQFTDFGKTSEVFFRSLLEVQVDRVDGVHLTGATFL